MVKVTTKPLTFGFETERVHHWEAKKDYSGYKPEAVRRVTNVERAKSYIPFYGQYKSIKNLYTASKMSEADKKKLNFKRQVARDVGTLFFANVFIYPFVDSAVTLKREAVQWYKEWKTSRKEKV